MARQAGPPRDNEAITDISVEVYKMALGPAGVKSMLAQDNDDGVKLRNRAKVRNPTTVMYLRVLGLPIPRLPPGTIVISGHATTWTITQAGDMGIPVSEQTEMNGTAIKGLFG